MAYEYAVITNAGRRMLNEALVKKVVLDNAGGGAGSVNPAQLMAQTELSDKRQTFDVLGITEADQAGGRGKKLNIHITNAGLGVAYQMRQVGIYAHLEGENEDRPELFAILQDETGYNIPSEEELADFSVSLYATIAVGTDANIQVKTDPAALVNMAALGEAIAEHDTSADAHKGVFAKAEDLAGKQDELTFDDSPEDDSENPVKSGGVKKYVDDAVDGAKSPSHDIQLPASGWAEGKQTVSDPWLELDGFDYVIVAAPVSWTAYNEAGIRAEDMTVTGSMTFVCDEIPQTDLTAHVMKVATKEG